MYNLHLSPEQVEFRDTVRDFVDDEVKPVTLKADRLDLSDRTLPVEVLRKASRMGLRTLALPEDMGGVGADALTCCIITEELAVGDTDVAAVLAETSSLGLRLFAAMTAEQRARFGQTFLEDDDYHLALACREPGDDSALGINYHRPAPDMRLATTAARDGDHWIINGAKDCVANAPIAKLIAVEAQTDKGPALFLIPRETPGFGIDATQHTMGLHGTGHAFLTYDNMAVPDKYRLGEVGHGLEVALFFLDYSRVSLSNSMVGLAQRALDEAVRFSKRRTTFGKAIASRPQIQTHIATMQADIEAARHLVAHAALLCEQGKDFTAQAATAKLFNLNMIGRVTDLSLRVHGGWGYTREAVIERIYRDARGFWFEEGTAEIQQLVVARYVLDKTQEV